MCVAAWLVSACGCLAGECVAASRCSSLNARMLLTSPLCSDSAARSIDRSLSPSTLSLSRSPASRSAQCSSLCTTFTSRAARPASCANAAEASTKRGCQKKKKRKGGPRREREPCCLLLLLLTCLAAISLLSRSMTCCRFSDSLISDSNSSR